VPETGPEQGIDCHGVQDEHQSDKRQRSYPEAEGESGANTCCEQKEQSLDNEENSEDLSRRIDGAEMNQMVDSSDPEPEKGKHTANDAVGYPVVGECQEHGENAEQICRNLHGPDGGVVGAENIEELFVGERYFQEKPLFTLIFNLHCLHGTL
jgi:hypothetical protein